ncbi:MAG: hypothetical protein A2Z34_01480 [Planctomycetes bacterium RBG_16_59_8]|nr:MAG: hypothetical protein A2Z34_01480 [Planctomycetes bacterium RBG_16_59_8]
MELKREEASLERFDVALTWGFRLLALLLPLFWIEGLLDFAYAPKKALVNVAAWALLAILLFRWLSSGRAVIRRSPLIHPFLLLILFSILSSCFVALNLMLALDDTFSYLSLTVLLFVALHHFRDLQRVDDLLDRLLISGTIAVLIGICQYHGIAFQGITQTESPGIMFAHQNMAAEYLILLLPVAIYRALRTRIVAMLYLYGATGSLFFLFTLYVRARATWLGMAVAFVLFLILWRVRKRATLTTAEGVSALHRHRRAAVLLGLLLILAMGWVVPAPPSRGKIDIVERIGSISRTGEGTTPFRMEVWRSSWGMIVNHPFLGVGVGNWEIYFPKHLWIWDKKQTEEYFGMRDTTMGAGRGAVHTHNDYLHMVSEFGIGGIVFLVLLIFLLFRSALRVCRMDLTGDRSLCVLFVMTSIVLFGVIGIFSFPFELAPHSALFMLFVALLAGQENDVGGAPTRVVTGKGGLVAAFCVALIFLCVAGVYHFRLLMADRCVFRTTAAESHFEKIGLFDESLRWHWNNYDTHFQFGVARHYAGDYYAAELDKAVKEGVGENRRKFVERLMLDEYAGALNAYTVTKEMNPYRFAAMNNSGLILQSLAVRCQRRDYMESALEEYYRILLILPDHHKAVRQIALMCCQLGEWERAKRIVEERLMRLTENDRAYGRLLLEEIAKRERSQ